jgi:hypothetical protein
VELIRFSSLVRLCASSTSARSRAAVAGTNAHHECDAYAACYREP